MSTRIYTKKIGVTTPIQKEITDCIALPGYLSFFYFEDGKWELQNVSENKRLKHGKLEYHPGMSFIHHTGHQMAYYSRQDTSVVLFDATTG